MKIVLLGSTGQLGWELQRSLAVLGEVTALGRHTHLGVDFLHPCDVAGTVHALKPDIIVNAASYTDVDGAEMDLEAVTSVNAVTPGLLAEVAKRISAWMVHYSSDYVFDGSGKTPWREGDRMSPINEYGRSKQTGEDNIRAAGCRHLIFRTSWLCSSRRQNFINTVLELGQRRNTLTIVDDQFGAPTTAELVADVTAHVLRQALRQPHLAGTYHVAAHGVTTWFHYARHIVEHARTLGLPVHVPADQILPISSAALGRAATRPANSRLDTRKLRSTFRLHMPEWQTGVERMLAEIRYREEDRRV